MFQFQIYLSRHTYQYFLDRFDLCNFCRLVLGWGPRELLSIQREATNSPPSSTLSLPMSSWLSLQTSAWSGYPVPQSASGMHFPSRPTSHFSLAWGSKDCDWYPYRIRKAVSAAFLAFGHIPNFCCMCCGLFDCNQSLWSKHNLQHSMLIVLVLLFLHTILTTLAKKHRSHTKAVRIFDVFGMQSR